MLVLRPRPYWNSILLRSNSLKACIFHPSFQLRSRIWSPAKILTRFQQRRCPTRNRSFWPHRAVFRVVCELEVLEFCIATGLCKFERLFHELRPVDYRGGHVSRMDEVKTLAKGPWLFAVIDFELHI